VLRVINIVEIPINKVGELLDGSIHAPSNGILGLPDTADFGLAACLTGM
jgi:hypothetical protein